MIADLEKNYRGSVLSKSSHMSDPSEIHPDEHALVIAGREKKNTGVSYAVNYEKAWLVAEKRAVFRLTDTCDKARYNERQLHAVPGSSDGK